MNDWHIAGIRIHIHPLFWFVILASVWTGYFIEMATLFTLVIIHELGHVFMARAYGWRIRSIQLLPFGGVAEVDDWGNTSPREELMVALAGPFLNAVMFLMGVVFGGIGLWGKEWAEYFVWSNAMIAGFNLLPVWPLDGGKIMQALFSMGMAYRRAVYSTLLISFLGTAIMLVIAGLHEPPHLNLLAVGGYLFFHNVMDYRRAPYQLLRFVMMKYKQVQAGVELPFTYSFLTPHTRLMDSVKFLRKGRYHHFLIVAGDAPEQVRIVTERELLAAYFEKKQLQCAVAEIFV